MSKVDQKRNWVKLKSIRTFLRIACLANRKSYVVIICASSCANLTNMKLGQVEVTSNIAQNHFHSSQEVISAHYVDKFIL